MKAEEEIVLELKVSVVGAIKGCLVTVALSETASYIFERSSGLRVNRK